MRPATSPSSIIPSYRDAGLVAATPATTVLHVRLMLTDLACAGPDSLLTSASSPTLPVWTESRGGPQRRELYTINEFRSSSFVQPPCDEHRSAPSLFLRARFVASLFTTVVQRFRHRRLLKKKQALRPREVCREKPSEFRQLHPELARHRPRSRPFASAVPACGPRRHPRRSSRPTAMRD